MRHTVITHTYRKRAPNGGFLEIPMEMRPRSDQMTCARSLKRVSAHLGQDVSARARHGCHILPFRPIV